MNTKAIILSLTLWYSTSFASCEFMQQFTWCAATFVSVASGCIGLVRNPAHAHQYWKLIGFGVVCGGVTYLIRPQQAIDKILQNQSVNTLPTPVINDNQNNQSNMAMIYYKIVSTLKNKL